MNPPASANKSRGSRHTALKGNGRQAVRSEAVLLQALTSISDVGEENTASFAALVVCTLEKRFAHIYNRALLLLHTFYPK